MHPDDQRKASAGLLIGLPCVGWLTMATRTETLPSPKWPVLWDLIQQTPGRLDLLGGAMAGLLLGIGTVWHH